MAGLIALNLVRNRGRTALTAAGIAIGVATIVALLALTQGLKESVGGLGKLGHADLGLFQGGVADLTVSNLPRSMVAQVKRQPGVRDAAAISLVTDALPDDPSALVFGVAPDSFVSRRLVIGEGARAGPGEAMVGDGFAASQGVGPGDTVLLKGEPFRVAGVYSAGVGFEDAGLVVSMAAASRLAGDRLGVTTIAVTLEPQAAEEEVATELRRRFPGTITIANPGQAARANPGFGIVTKAVLVIAALALVLGGIAVANTMAMVALERRRELALLGAIGWSPRQVGAIVVGEGAGVGLLGACVGVAVGVALSQVIVGLLEASDFVSPVLTPWVIGRGLLIGLAIGVLGGVYPAWRVSRQPPAALLGRF